MMIMNEPLPKNARLWGMGCHLSGTIAALVGTPLMLPFFTLLLPLIVWQIGRDRHPFIDEQGRAVMNFLISMTIYGVASSVLSAFLLFITCGVVLGSSNGSSAATDSLVWLWYCFLLGVAIFVIFQVAVTIFAAVKASKGQSYRYPFALSFLSGSSV
jgi:hypothetical protein